MNNKENGCIHLNIFTCLVLLFSALSVVNCTKSPQVAQQVVSQPEVAKPSDPAPRSTSLERWQKLVQENRYASIDQKLVGVTEFFNRFDSIEDKYLWGRDDYWATLFETLEMSGGDCEDFTIAKYFTLRELNIPEESMRLTYVISLKTKKPHMVLTLLRDSSQEPIVLDSNNNYLFPVSMRQDLVPVFSFNADGYWLAKKGDGWKGKRIGSAAKLSLWQSVLLRMKEGEVEISSG
jgi:predicted transglutaminase-like cysteine proteinase